MYVCVFASLIQTNISICWIDVSCVFQSCGNRDASKSITTLAPGFIAGIAVLLVHANRSPRFKDARRSSPSEAGRWMMVAFATAR